MQPRQPQEDVPWDTILRILCQDLQSRLDFCRCMEEDMQDSAERARIRPCLDEFLTSALTAERSLRLFLSRRNVTKPEQEVLDYLNRP